MTEKRVNRKLAAILSADVVGYSKLMADDEAATVSTLKQYREAVGHVIERHKGRIVNAPGDNILAEFASAVEAVQAAVEIQKSIEGRNVELPDDRRMHLRIGLNLGDVIEEDDGTIYGDGVNIAARMEALAEEGGICISSTIHDAVEGKLDFGFDFLGERPVKNIAKPVRVYRVRDEPGERPIQTTTGQTKKLPLIMAAVVLVVAIAGVSIWQSGGGPASEETETAPETSDPVLALPTGPSIAVLPFVNMSGDPDQEYFVDGLTEQVISALTRFSGLRVSSRNSAFQFKGKAVDVGEIGRKLDVRYILEGSIRKANNIIRVTAQLIDVTTDSHLWAQTYERELTATNIFALQDDITEKVVAKVGQRHGVIPRAAMSREVRKETDSLFAYDCVLRGYEYYRTLSPEPHKVALPCLLRAVEIAPTYADAWAWLSIMHGETYKWGYSGVENPREAALLAAQRAVELDPDSATTREALANAHYLLHDVERFYIEADRAMALNPNDPSMLGSLGNFIAYTGRWDRGVALVNKAMALDPVHPGWFYMAPGKKHYWERDFATALAVFKKVGLPGFWMNQLQFAYTLGQLPGREGEAAAAVTKLQDLYPGFSIETFYEEYRKYNFTREFMDLAADGLRKAGLPEAQSPD